MLSKVLGKLTLSLLPRWTIFSVFLSLNISLFAQQSDKQLPPPTPTPRPLNQDQELLRDLRKNLLGDKSLLEKYFQKGFLDKVDKMFEDSLRDLDKDSQNFDSFFRNFQDSFQSIGSGLNNKWIDTKEGRVLIVEGAVTQGGNFDLKVKDGMVSISGSLERELGKMGKRTMSFSNSFPVPRGTDPNKVRIENKDDGIHVIFPWEEKGKAKTVNPSKKDQKRPDKRPLKKDKEDLII